MNYLIEPSKSAFPQPTAQVVVITPERASELLANNPINRSVSVRQLAFLKKQLLDGKWLLNGETIKVASDGTLLDGQHRLMACAQTGVPMPSLFIDNVPKETMHTIDTGKNRNGVDVISMFLGKDQKYSSKISSTAKFIMMFDKGAFGQINTGDKDTNPDNADYIAFVKKTEGFVPFVEEKIRLYAKGDKLVEPKIFVGLYWVISKKATSIEMVDDFFTKLSIGSGIESDSPIFLLRQKLITTKGSKTLSSNGSKISFNQKIWSIVKAWNYYRGGKKMTAFGIYPSDPILIIK